MKRLYGLLAIAVSLMLLLTACGGGGGDETTPTTTDKKDQQQQTTTTTVSGKVTLSSTTSKPSAKAQAIMTAPKGKLDSKLFYATRKTVSNKLDAMLSAQMAATALEGATVFLYDSDHPEWIYPVSWSFTCSSGDPTCVAGEYKLSTIKTRGPSNEVWSNSGATYKDGDPIPAGKYTLVAFKFALGAQPQVAIQTVVKNFEGDVTGTDLMASESSAVPYVDTMFGVKKNTDGTPTWGSSNITMPANAVIQVTFGNPMWRGDKNAGYYLNDYITISPSVSGKWALSADWLTATFYPDKTTYPNGIPLDTYTITVKGKDLSTQAAVNVYGNKLPLTAVGTFKTVAKDDIAPTAEWESPTTLDMANPVDITIPFKIRSNKQLDVNTLVLEAKATTLDANGNPITLGAKPGVVYKGKNATGYYIYEFILGEPLRIGLTYDLKVSGGKGVNGVIMNTLTGSVQTKSADLITGVSTTASSDIQLMQAQVLDVFGKWVRALSDRSLAQLTTMMSGDFYMEYDPTQYNGIPSDDLNRDGRYSLSEFSNMLATEAFPGWEFCQTTLTGIVVGTVNITGDSTTGWGANFEFTLSATSQVGTQECQNAAPNQSLYATLKQINGAWTIVRASEGIDTRSNSISFYSIIKTYLTTSTGSVNPADYQFPDMNMSSTFSWDPPATATGPVPVASYVFVLFDGRYPDRGAALALDPSTPYLDLGPDGPTTQFVDVSQKFGFDIQQFYIVQGGEYYWEILALKTIAPSSINAPTTTDLAVIQDIGAVSNLNRLTFAGIYRELAVSVLPAGTTTPLVWNEMMDGFDAGSAGRVDIIVSEPTATGITNPVTARMNVNGSKYQYLEAPFDCSAGTSCTASFMNVEMSQGWNWIDINDSTMGGNTALYKSFGINAPNGTPPVLKITKVTGIRSDTTTTVLTGDMWYRYDSRDLDTNGLPIAGTGARQVTIEGTLQTPLTSLTLYVNVWNDKLGAQSHTNIQASGNGTTATFSATVDVYNGDNWISVSDNSGNSGNFGLYTENGTTWVPPIVIDSIADYSSDSTPGLADMNYNYGMGSDWSATPFADYTVTINGHFKTPLLPIDRTKGKIYKYGISSEGAGWQEQEITVNADGSFSITPVLYEGWSWINIQDPDYNWYSVNIQTATGTGKQVIKVTVTAISSATFTTTPYGDVTFNSTNCTAKIDGTALSGGLSVSWDGNDVNGSYHEYQTVQAVGSPDAAVTFSATVPLVSGTNTIYIQDQNYRSLMLTGTTTASCTYTQPVLTIDSMTSSPSGTVLVDQGGGQYNAGIDTSLTISGTSTRPGMGITVTNNICNQRNIYTTQASQTEVTTGSGTYAWSVSGVAIVGAVGAGYWNGISVNDSMNNIWMQVYSTNAGAVPSPAIVISSLTGTGSPVSPSWVDQCGTNYSWNLTADTTVTITFTVTGSSGSGEYYDATNSRHSFTYIDGTPVTIGPIDVYDQSNGIQIHDANWNWAWLNIYTTNGTQKPKFVWITTPAYGSTGVSGVQTVTANFADPLTPPQGFNPSNFNAYVNVGRVMSDVTGTWCSSTTFSYSSDPNAKQWDPNILPISVPTAGTFTFDVDFGTVGDAACSTYINVNAWDNYTGMNHYYSYQINTTYPYQSWNKPGVISGSPSAKEKAFLYEALKWFSKY